MRLFKWGASALENVSPLGLVLLGASLAYTFVPVARRITRTTAVLATRGILSINDKTKEISANMKEQLAEIVAEAKIQHPEEALPENKQNLRDLAQQKTRSLAVAATGGALSVAEGVKAWKEGLKEQINDLVAEAKAKSHEDSAEAAAENPDNDI